MVGHRGKRATGRTDIMLGNMGWTPVRAKVLLITDAIYYAGTFAP